MRVALVHLRHAASGGTERHLSQLARGLAERGHAVTIVCRSREATPHPEVAFRQLRAPAPGALARRWVFGWQVARHVAQAGYDVVYALGRTWSHDALRLGGGCHASYRERAHPVSRPGRGPGAGLDALRHRGIEALEARGVAAARAVVVNSAAVGRDVVARHGVPPERVHRVYNGVDLDRFRPGRDAAARALRRNWGIDDEAPLLLFLGNGYGRKGLAPLLDAFARLRPTQAGLRLVVAGRESRSAYFESRARRLGLEGAVRFVGPRRDAERCYRAADLYVLPTLYDPFAHTTLEALACGVPVVTSAANGAAELLVEGREGSVLPDGAEPELLAERLRAWLAPGRAAAASSAARRLAERHPESRVVDETEALLQRLARERAVGPVRGSCGAPAPGPA